MSKEIALIAYEKSSAVGYVENIHVEFPRFQFCTNVITVDGYNYTWFNPSVFYQNSDKTRGLRFDAIVFLDAPRHSTGPSDFWFRLQNGFLIEPQEERIKRLEDEVRRLGGNV